MEERTLRPYKNFRWIVADPELLGGKLAVRGTRFSVSFILSCMSEGMTVEDIEETYGRLPHDAMPEVMRHRVHLTMKSQHLSRSAPAE